MMQFTFAKLRSCARLLVVLLLMMHGSSAVRADNYCFFAAAIPDNSEVLRTVIVPPTSNAMMIQSIRVHAVIMHPWVGDLVLRLRNPEGFEVSLLNRAGMPSVGYPGAWGCGGDNIDVWFDDAASAAAELSCPYGQVPILAGALRPFTPLSPMRGLSPTGVWTLIVGDGVAGDVGTLTAACVEMVLVNDCNHNGVADASDIAAGVSADLNGDGVPDECGCSGDFDGNSAVDAADLASLLTRWGACSACEEDVNGDGIVGGSDLAALLSQWGSCGAQ